jgi:hypothetical protein
LERQRWRSYANARAGDRRGGVAIGSQGAGGLQISNHDRRGDLAAVYDFGGGAAACIVRKAGWDALTHMNTSSAPEQQPYVELYTENIKVSGVRRQT